MARSRPEDAGRANGAGQADLEKPLKIQQNPKLKFNLYQGLH